MKLLKKAQGIKHTGISVFPPLIGQIHVAMHHYMTTRGAVTYGLKSHMETPPLSILI